MSGEASMYRTRAFLAIGLSCALLLSGCTATPPKPPTPGSWVKAGATLPGGDRFIVQDTVRDSLWLFTIEYVPNGGRDGTLSEVSWTGRVISNIKLGKVQGPLGLIGGGIALDRHGNVWMVWGTRLTKFDPATRVMKVYPIPLAAAARNVRTDLRGDPSGLAISGDVIWTATSRIRVLRRFDSATETWLSDVPIPLLPGGTLTTLPDGRVIAGGIRPSFATEGVAVVDPKTLRVTRHNVDELYAFTVLRNGKLLHLTAVGGIATSISIFDLATDKDALFIPRLVSAYGSWVDEQSALWLVQYSPRVKCRSGARAGCPEAHPPNIYIDRLDLTTKRRVAYGYPAKRWGNRLYTGTCGIGAQNCQPAPDDLVPTNIQMVVASRSRVLVFTDFPDDARLDYPPIYRLVL